jgi:hypothetical protein
MYSAALMDFGPRNLLDRLGGNVRESENSFSLADSLKQMALSYKQEEARL